MRTADDSAFMQLVLANQQGELSPLEIRVHVFQAVPDGKKGRGNKGGLREYAKQINKDHAYVIRLRAAAEVFYTFKTQLSHLA